jgi:hypothetical protein
LCCLCAETSESTSLEVEPIHTDPAGWQGGSGADASASSSSSTPMVSEPHPPPLPRDAFLPLDTPSEPRSNLPMVKIGAPLKSSMKWPKSRTRVMQDDAKPMNGNCPESEGDAVATASQPIEKRSIMWQDNHGKKLTEVKVFEPRYCCSSLSMILFI